MQFHSACVSHSAGFKRGPTHLLLASPLLLLESVLLGALPLLLVRLHRRRLPQHHLLQRMNLLRRWLRHFRLRPAPPSPRSATTINY